MTCPHCGDVLEIGSWPFCGPQGHPQVRQFKTAFDERDSCVVFEHPVTGEVRYPGRNDAPMPERYAQAGFQRTEMRSLRAIEKFEKKHNVWNERAWCDSNARGEA